MDWLLYIVASGIVAALQAFPLTWVARFGRCLGGLVYALDARHRRVAINNLTMCLGGEKTPEEIRAIAKENFRRIGENFASAVKTSAMSLEQLQTHMEVTGVQKVAVKNESGETTSCVIAIGHFGNFELFAHAAATVPGYRAATTYRALRGAGVNRLLLRLREKSGCLYFERRTEGGALREAMRSQRIMLGLLSDQHSGDHGVRIPFFGKDCTTTKSPAVFALRFDLPLYAAFCFRTRPGHWRVEVGDEIPTRENGEPREVEAIMRDVNAAFEVAVRRDPANWFWVHNRWKVRKKKPAPSPAPAEPVPHIEAAGEDPLIKGE
jgi:KDO2-lipid IV(A) lauroyltransferase